MYFLLRFGINDFILKGVSIDINETRLPPTVIRQHWLEQWMEQWMVLVFFFCDIGIGIGIGIKDFILKSAINWYQIGINETRLPPTVIRQHWLEQWLVSHTLTPLSSGRSSKFVFRNFTSETIL